MLRSSRLAGPAQQMPCWQFNFDLCPNGLEIDSEPLLLQVMSPKLLKFDYWHERCSVCVTRQCFSSGTQLVSADEDTGSMKHKRSLLFEKAGTFTRHRGNQMDHKEKEVGKMEENLKLLGAKIDSLAAKAESVGNEVKTDYRKRIDELKEKHAATRAKLDEMKSARNDKWEAFKTGVDKAWNELEVAFRKLAD
jgi:hypothetical protein